MDSSPIKSSNMSTATKDALFLFDLFRESPTPILIQIGPYANKTGAKPNTIIKRLAGIKARNGLNINTTLGSYTRPSDQSPATVKTEPKPRSKPVKKEHPKTDDIHLLTPFKSEDNEVAQGNAHNSVSQPDFGNGPLTPAPSPSSSMAYQNFQQQHYTEPMSQLHFSPVSNTPDHSSSKRSFEQTHEAGTHNSELDGVAWKRVKAEG